ncbi:MBOAT family protein [Ulvibacter sp. MAR_2010_11]|uniref:MBOAT family O-acyltransferase n=1 Tax=Ulvibacter sp. MAR_2010_11 TaxID=1250229 RepID=UPI001E4C564E|nr:MBOAT family O-acyltransferase [Ulvibacter sp. MAR_2010_11]
MLLGTSYIFYGLWNPPLIVLLWISTMVDWTTGNRLHKEDSASKRKMWLLLSMVVNLGFLAFFKYGGFLLENFSLLVNSLGINYNPAKPDILLPMGISFYTFQTMSYTIDIYNKKIKPAKSFLDFALYVTFFPQLVAGPIVRAKGLLNQFKKPKKATRDQFIWGAFLLTLGLFQKVVLADTLLAPTADTVFKTPYGLASIDAWSGVLAFSGQIFFDFAGYSTSAIGIAMMLGFFLPHNFLYPYASIGFSDLWRRWHISLSTWLRDYLYIPMGGNQKGLVRTYVFLMITMLLGGLWHGAAWTFVAWGALHGFYLIVERILKNNISIKINRFTGIALALLTFICVNIAWVFFRASDFQAAISILASMFSFNSGGTMVIQYLDIYITFIVIGLMFISHWVMRNRTLESQAIKRQPLIGVVWGVMLVLLFIAQSNGEQFIYFQF